MEYTPDSYIEDQDKKFRSFFGWKIENASIFSDVGFRNGWIREYPERNVSSGFYRQVTENIQRFAEKGEMKYTFSHYPMSVKKITEDNIEALFISEVHNKGYTKAYTNTGMIPLFDVKNEVKDQYYYGLGGKTMYEVLPTEDRYECKDLNDLCDSDITELMYEAGLDKLLRNLRHKGAYITGSFITNLFSKRDLGIDELDIYIAGVGVNKMQRFALDVYRELEYDTMEQMSLYRYNLKKKGSYNLDIFTSSGGNTVDSLIRYFHFPCVRAMYDVYEGKIYAFPTFIDFLKTGVCVNSAVRWANEDGPYAVVEKYFNRGIGYLLCKEDMTKITDYFDTKDIDYNVVEKKIP